MMSCINTPGFGNNSTGGQIQIVFGPMFSGKTTELMRRMKRFQIANYKCLVIKYSKDTRYADDGIATHDRQTLAAVGATELHTLKSLAIEQDVLGVDEGQFFPDVVEFCELMADMGKTVIVSALDGDYRRKGFGSILNLVPLAEHIVKLNAICMECYGEASFTKRKGSEKEVEIIGGADKYLAVCRGCYKPRGQVSPACSPRTRVLSAFPQGSPASKARAGRKLFAHTEGKENSVESTMETAS